MILDIEEKADLRLANKTRYKKENLYNLPSQVFTA